MTETERLSKHILDLQKDKGELIDKTRELERKIASIRGSHRVDLAKLNARIEQVERLKKENAELKKQINEWLNAYSDTNLVKVLRDCIYKNEKLSSQEQQQLSAWVECAMDFGSNLDECADQLTKAKEYIKLLLMNCVGVYESTGKTITEIQAEAEQFLSEVEK